MIYKEDVDKIADAVREVILSDEFLAAFVKKWLDTPLPKDHTDEHSVS